VGRRRDLDPAGKALYLRAAANAEEMLEVLPEMSAQRGLLGVLATSGDRWGRVDRGAIEDLLPDNFMGEAADLPVQGLSPSSFTPLVTDAESVEEVGTKEIDGETMTGDSAARSSTTTVAEGEPEPGSVADVMAGLHGQVGWTNCEVS
jgi:hypothetical protein